MINIMLCGLDKKLDMYLNILQNYKNVNIMGILSFRKQVFSFIDGIPVFYLDDCEEQIKNIDLILLSNVYKFPENHKYNIWRDKVITEDIFKIPALDFEVYIKARKSKICIVSDDCWGVCFINMHNYHLHHHLLIYQFRKTIIICSQII